MGHERPGLLTTMRLFVVTEPKRVFAVKKRVFLLGFVSFFLPEGRVANVWLPISPQRLFDFLRDERLRSEAMNSNESSNMLILQETCTDASWSLVVYALVDILAMHVVMSGGDPAYVALLPSGFAILPGGPECRPLALNPTGKGVGVNNPRMGGSLLTVAFQILVNSLPTAKLIVESVETVNNLISYTVQKINVTLHCEDS
eukprot:PITA_32445